MKTLITFLNSQEKTIQVILSVVFALIKILLMVTVISIQGFAILLGIIVLSLFKEPAQKPAIKGVSAIAEAKEIEVFDDIWETSNTSFEEEKPLKIPDNFQENRVPFLFLLPPAKEENSKSSSSKTEFKKKEKVLKPKSTKKPRGNLAKEAALKHFGTLQKIKKEFPTLNLKRTDSWEIIAQHITTTELATTN